MIIGKSWSHDSLKSVRQADVAFLYLYQNRYAAALLAKLAQYRQQVLGKQARVLGEREMPDALHRLEPDAGNLRRRRLRQLDGAGIVVLAGQHEQAAAVGVDPSHPLAPVPVAGVERDVAIEHPRAAGE